MSPGPGRFHHVGRASDVPPQEGRSVAVAGRRIAVFRLERGWAAVDHACPHAGGPLADGLVAGACVTCPLHGWRIDLRMGAVHGRAHAVAVHEIAERDGDLWVALADTASLAQAA